MKSINGIIDMKMLAMSFVFGPNTCMYSEACQLTQNVPTEKSQSQWPYKYIWIFLYFAAKTFSILVNVRTYTHTHTHSKFIVIIKHIV